MKKLLNTLYITDETAYLSRDGENVVCTTENSEPFRIPFSNIESIFCFSYVGCSPALMGKCVESNISLCFISPTGRFLAKVVGETKGNVFLRKQQIEKFSACDLTLIQNTVAAKLCNTGSVIRRTLRDYPETDAEGRLSGTVEALNEATKRVYENKDIEIIRGIEGNAAKNYFDIFDSLILAQKDDFRLLNRTKRPPLDRTNAVLSFLYTIFTNDFASALECVGLDSYIGFYHTLRPGRASLACDLVEEARCLVDRAVLTMINLKILNKDDFDAQVSGAVFLSADGRKKVLKFWQEKKRDTITHPYLKEKIPRGLIPYVQANLLAKYIRSELSEYPSFLLK